MKAGFEGDATDSDGSGLPFIVLTPENDAEGALLRLLGEAATKASIVFHGYTASGFKATSFSFGVRPRVTPFCANCRRYHPLSEAHTAPLVKCALMECAQCGVSASTRDGFCSAVCRSNFWAIQALRQKTQTSFADTTNVSENHTTE